MEITHSLLMRLKENERIAQKFNEIEISILTILNFQDFLEKLLCAIRDKFSIDYNWISIIEDSDIARQLSEIKDSELLRELPLPLYQKSCFLRDEEQSKAIAGK